MTQRNGAKRSFEKLRSQAELGHEDAQSGSLLLRRFFGRFAFGLGQLRPKDLLRVLQLLALAFACVIGAHPINSSDFEILLICKGP